MHLPADNYNEVHNYPAPFIRQRIGWGATFEFDCGSAGIRAYRRSDFLLAQPPVDDNCALNVASGGAGGKQRRNQQKGS